MQRFARIVDARVAEIIELPEGVSLSDRFHPDIAAVCTPCGADVAPGWVQGEGGFAAPAAPVPVRRTRFSFLEFMDLFTDAEQLAIAGAAMTDVATKLWYDRAVGAQFIDLTDARLTGGLQAMVTAGLLTSGRRDRVLAGLPPAA